jgi:hypothetical protein
MFFRSSKAKVSEQPRPPVLSEPKSVSKTPILDLLAPLPKPQHQKPSNRLRYTIATVALVGIVSANYPMLVFFGCILLVFWLQVAVHEIGHLIAGRLVGLRFESVSVGSLWFVKKQGKLKIQFKRHVLWGQACMSLDKLRRVRKKLLVFIAGGPIASLACGFFAIAAAKYLDTRVNDTIPAMIDLFAYLSLFTAYIGIFPLRYGIHPNDALMIKMLIRSKVGARHLIASYAVRMQQRRGVDPFDLNERWVQLAFAPGASPQADYFAAWKNYVSVQRTGAAVAADCLEACLAGSAVLSPDQRDHLISEAAYFTAKHRQDPVKTRTWLARIANFSDLHPMERFRVGTALSEAEGRPSEALQFCKDAIRFLQASRSNARATRTELDWQKWREHLEGLGSAPKAPATEP